MMVISLMGYGAYQGYVHSIPTVSDEFNEYGYRPFSIGYLATLDKPSTLQLTTNLPKIDGSTALYPLYSAFATAVYPKSLQDDYETLDKTIALSKTGEAYERLLKKEVDIIFVPEPSKEHLAKAKELGVEFKLTPIGKEAFVFFVNSKNPVNELSVSQIQDIYTGKITNWQEVGGKNDKIRAFQRPENSGSQTALQKIMGDKPLMTAPREMLQKVWAVLSIKWRIIVILTMRWDFRFYFIPQNWCKKNKLNIWRLTAFPQIMKISAIKLILLLTHFMRLRWAMKAKKLNSLLNG